MSANSRRGRSLVEVTQSPRFYMLVYFRITETPQKFANIDEPSAAGLPDQAVEVRQDRVPRVGRPRGRTLAARWLPTRGGDGTLGDGHPHRLAA